MPAYSELDVDGEAFDRPACPLHAKIIICSTERSGSYLLCRAMIRHDIGVPHEYFHWLHAKIIGPRVGLSAFQDSGTLASDARARRDYIAALISRRTVNGIFAAKIHWWQFAHYLNNPEGYELLQGAYFIHLYREDLLDQAVSFHTAWLTGKWGADDTLTTNPAEQPNFFDDHAVMARLETLARDDMNWRVFFACNGISPLRLSYEILSADVEGALKRVVDSFALDVSARDLAYREAAPVSGRNSLVPPKSAIKSRFVQVRRRLTPATPCLQVPNEAARQPAAEEATVPADRVLCLHMVVQDARERLERHLPSFVGHIGCWIVIDSGSSDGTADFIRSFFAARSIPGELHVVPFENDAQVRNQALALARASPLHYDYLLLADANVELVSDEQGFRASLTKPIYRLPRRDNDGLVSWEIRLIHRDVAGRFDGVARAWLEMSGEATRLPGAWLRDLADPASRQGGAERDIVLLTQALAQEPKNFRYWFRLGEACRDAGHLADAASAYAKAAELGGADEEGWYACLQEARSRQKLGDEEGFVRLAVVAFDRRPQRAEPLYDVAKYFRERQQYDRSVSFSEPGLDIAPPDGDLLGIDEYAYAAGIRQEYSIAAYYTQNPARRARGHAACNWLALCRDIPAATRNLARANLRFYSPTAGEVMPSFAARLVEFEPPGGMRPTNPSVARWGDDIVMVQRCVDYTLDSDGNYAKFPVDDGLARNYLLRLDDDLVIRAAQPIRPPIDLPCPPLEAIGPVDLRLFAWRGALWCVGYIDEWSTGERWVNQMLARIAGSESGDYRLVEWRILRPEGARRHEKNWMPRVVGERLDFVYQCDPTRIVDEHARTVGETIPVIEASDLRGGTQAIDFDGGWLALVHEVSFRAAPARLYLHRFVWFDEANILRRITRQFFFRLKEVEYAAGLAWHPDGKRLLISYGVNDGESWIATVSAEDVRALLQDVARLPSGSLRDDLG